ncbi:cryptochrome-1 [Neocloeon triangulifer]|uniref:cryptochrome-1 n=1 Tax=Neocloeon triangulifer TaxID=2078957 RepID=UPI00286F2F5F|nr:cryptochrome-1 [Neocloeon triangulifer]
MNGQTHTSVLWFRHGLRLHDNPALLEAIKGPPNLFFPIFIFDGESAGTKLIGFNRMRFLLESLGDLDRQLRSVGGRLWLLRGNPSTILQRLWEEVALTRVCYERDCEPIWRARDAAVRATCAERGVRCVECVSHTLWDPRAVLRANGGTPPLTYQMFMHTAATLGEPPRPVDDPDWTGVTFGKLPPVLMKEFQVFDDIPKPEDFGLSSPGYGLVRWVGGETRALQHLKERLLQEENAFRSGVILPNQSRPDLLGPPTSQSAALRYGCLSVRRFFWNLHDIFNAVHQGRPPAGHNITGQLLWREFFYTMCVENEFYGEMARNPICLDIPWVEDPVALARWKKGETGFPFVDAAMRQLVKEGWVHHVARNAVACFLTRGDLWINWEEGATFFLENLIDGDWAINAGNWMWVSSSAFEQLLDCSKCLCPVNYGRRLDPWGEYIKRYLPELRNLPVEYLYEPWKAPLDVQKDANCIIGQHYPERIVDHQQASSRNRHYMQKIRESLMEQPSAHCCPSNEEETRQFMWLPEECVSHVLKN